MTSSKSSKTTCNIVMAILVIWSIISLIIIIVWATSPEIKDVNKCRTELEAQVQKLESARATWAQDRKALEEHLEASRERETQLNQQTNRLWESQRKTNESLKICLEENVLLRDNITALENETERQRELVKNLTSEITAHKEQLEDLQYNLTQAFHLMASCEASRSAAVNHQRAAESLVKACNSSLMSLQNQLNRCKKNDTSQQSQPSQQSQSTQSQPGSGSPGLHTCTSALSVLPFISLHLLFFL